MSSLHTPQERTGCREVWFLWTEVSLNFPTLGGSDFKDADEPWSPALYQDGETRGWGVSHA